MKLAFVRLPLFSESCTYVFIFILLFIYVNLFILLSLYRSGPAERLSRHAVTIMPIQARNNKIKIILAHN